MSVVQFPTKEVPPEDDSVVVWMCICGNSTFHLIEDGSAECAHCGSFVGIDGPNNWITLLPEAPTEAPTPDVIRKVVDMNDPRYNLALVLPQADADLTAFVLILQNDGDVHWWESSKLSDQERLDWFNSHVDQCRQALLSRANFTPG